MSIIFDPNTFVKKIAPPAKIKKLLKGNLTVKKSALSFATGIAEADDIAVKLDKKAITDVALKTVRGYQERQAKAIVDAGFDRAAGTEVKDEILDDPKQLIQRVQNEVVFQVHEKIKDQYAGQKARWLPSDAEEPRPEHQLNYGKVYVIGEGINGVEPGDEPGCRCGVEILTNEDQLQLD